MKRQAMVKVSVVVPVYNCRDYLEKCVKSLMEQSLREIEIILVDDGATDGSGELCDQFAEKDSRIVVIHQKNSGVCAARNVGIMAAKGEYIGFSDGDDFSHSEKFSVLYKNAKKYDCEISSAGFYIYYDKMNIRPIYGTNKLYVWDEHDVEPLKYGLESCVVTMAPYSMIVKSDLCKENLFEIGRKINEDRYFGFMVFAKAKRICHKDECLYYYVQRSGSVAHSKFNKNFFDCNYFADKMEQYINEHIPELAASARLNTCRTYLNVLKYILKDDDAIHQFEPEMKELICKIKKFGLRYMFKNLNKVRFVDMFLMCYCTRFYRNLIKMYMAIKNSK